MDKQRVCKTKSNKKFIQVLKLILSADLHERTNNHSKLESQLVDLAHHSRRTAYETDGPRDYHPTKTTSHETTKRLWEGPLGQRIGLVDSQFRWPLRGVGLGA